VFADVAIKPKKRRSTFSRSLLGPWKKCKIFRSFHEEFHESNKKRKKMQFEFDEFILLTARH